MMESIQLPWRQSQLNNYLVSQKEGYPCLRKMAMIPMKINIFERFKNQKNRVVLLIFELFKTIDFSIELDHFFSPDTG